MRTTTTVLAALALALGSTTVAGAAQEGPPEAVIVVLHDGVDARDAAADAAREHRAEVGHVYTHALQGYAAVVPQGRLRALRGDPRVAYVQPDGEVSVQAQRVPTGIDRTFASGNAAIGIAGDGGAVDVDVAVIDTGIDLEHPDLNVVGGVTCTESGGGPPWQRTASCSSGGDDDHYHGTHVAGTVAAIDDGQGVVGVAPGARLWAVKVLSSSGSGSESMVVAGIDWVAANADTIEVANMSLGGSGFSQAEYDAIQGAVDLGVAFAVAAGNSDADANDFSPAAFDNVLTVSALADFDGEPGGLGSPTCRDDQDDTLADFSNWGTAVDLAAPGVCILSTYPLEQGEYGTISGTSMASPHAAGALALLASRGFTRDAAGVQGLYDAVTGAGNLDWVDDSGDGILEPLLDVSDATLFDPAIVGEGGGTTNTAPTASFTADCTDLTCTFDATGSSDPDGDALEYAWDLGDTTSATGATVTHTYGADGTYTVTLSVSDPDGAADTATQEVTVAASSGGDEPAAVTLEVRSYKVKGVQHADLTWSGTTATQVDVLRDGVVVATITDDGAHTDSTGNKGGGSATYQVCEAGTATCSDPVTASW